MSSVSSASLSMATMSWPSAVSCSVRARPTLPRPTITICIGYTLLWGGAKAAPVLRFHKKAERRYPLCGESASGFRHFRVAFGRSGAPWLPRHYSKPQAKFNTFLTVSWPYRQNLCHFFAKKGLHFSVVSACRTLRGKKAEKKACILPGGVVKYPLQRRVTAEHERKCWNRQTGTFEVRVSMTCGFKSHLPHQGEVPRHLSRHFLCLRPCPRQTRGPSTGEVQ